tara:strand:+ start:854 stop:1096 length:243 start_codon:yes stop_codon:yes gene_type:complete
MTTELYKSAIAPLTQSDQFDIDDLTANIMDEIRNILKKYESHFPDWNDEDCTYTLDDEIYYQIYHEILNHKLETTKNKNT